MEQEEFVKYVLDIFRSQNPQNFIDLSGTKLKVNGIQLELNDSYRSYQQGEDLQKIVNCLIDVVSNKPLDIEDLPLATARNSILPCIRPLKSFNKMSLSMPFVNNAFILFVADYSNFIKPLSTDVLQKWGTTKEEIEHIARRNLEARTLSELEWNFGEEGSIAIFDQRDGYDSARLLLSDLHERLSPRLGREFYVAIPNRDSFLAFPTQSTSLVNKMIERVNADYGQKPCPISQDLFYVTQDGVAGTIADPVEE